MWSTSAPCSEHKRVAGGEDSPSIEPLGVRGFFVVNGAGHTVQVIADVVNIGTMLNVTNSATVWGLPLPGYGTCATAASTNGSDCVEGILNDVFDVVGIIRSEFAAPEHKRVAGGEDSRVLRERDRTPIRRAIFSTMLGLCPSVFLSAEPLAVRRHQRHKLSFLDFHSPTRGMD